MAPDRGLRRADDAHDRLVEVAGGRHRQHRLGGDVGHDCGIADVAARDRRRGGGLVAEVGEEPRAATALPLDVLPDGAVLGPADPLRVADHAQALGGGRTVPAAGDRAGRPVRRRRGGREDAGPGEDADHRTDTVGVVGLPAPGTPAAAVADQPGEIGQLDVVAAVHPRPHEPLGDAHERVVGELGALDEEHVQSLVTGLGQQKTPSRPAVSSGAARLLVVGLQRARDGRVDHSAHVGLVDAHPEGVGGDDHLGVAAHERGLGVAALLAGQARVVDGDLDPLQRAGQLGAELLAGATGARVHHGGAGGGVRQRGQQPAALVGGAAAGDDAEAEVGAIETGGDVDGVAQPQPALDVDRDLRGGGGGESDRRLGPDRGGGVGQREVVGPEVMAPLGDAVGLVDDEQPDVQVAQRAHEAAGGEPLGRHVEQADLTGDDPFHRARVAGAAALAVDERHLAGGDRVDRERLVAHQRDERRDDDREVVAHQRRQLVAERLARAGGHHHERVVVVERGADRLLLPGPELVEMKAVQQLLAGIHHPLTLSLRPAAACASPALWNAIVRRAAGAANGPGHRPP